MKNNYSIMKGIMVIVLFTDASINYTQPKYEIGIAAENLFNTKWNEAQFATASRLRSDPAAVNELNYTPGTPFFVRIKFGVFF